MKTKNDSFNNIFIAILFCIILNNKTAKAQIVYTNLIPDNTVTCNESDCSDSVSIDLNNDGVNDFYIIKSNSIVRKCVVKAIESIIIYSLDSNSVVTSNDPYPIQLNEGDIISSSNYMKTIGTLRQIYSFWNCTWGGLAVLV